MAKRKGRDSSGHVDPFYQRRKRFETFFRVLKLDEPFAQLPRSAQEGMWRVKFPDPILEFDAGFPARPEDRALRQEIEAAFRNAVFHVHGQPVVMREFLGILAGVKLALENTDPMTLPPKVGAFAMVAREQVEALYTAHWTELTTSLIAQVSRPIIYHSRLDQRVLWTKADWHILPSKKGTVRVTVGSELPQARRVTLDGQPRTAYRAAVNWNGTGAAWVSWTREQLDRRHGPESYPVFVQGHALLNLHARVNLPSSATVIESWLSESLREPNIVERQGRDLLIEYRLDGYRLGYLIATPLDDCVVVRTFKFLTMEGTPEAKMLRSRLGLTRRDIDWLRLDELSAFTQTDLSSDFELCVLFEQCGCGHLFEVGGIDFSAAPRPYAADVRKYLCIAA